MANSPNLGIEHIEAAQNQKEVTANEAFDRLDNAVSKGLYITATADYTLTSDEMQESSFVQTVSADADRTITFPNNTYRNVVFRNDSDTYTMSVLPALGATYLVGPNETVLFRFDGSGGMDACLTNVESVDIRKIGTVVADEVLDYVYIDGDAYVKGGSAYALTAPTGATTFNIDFNGTTVGTAAFGAGSNTATVAFTDVSLTGSGRLELVAPNPADGTISGVALTIRLAR